ncbi:MAG: TAXI family TRAP transporter solute-binding subunit [Alphaproteobacteria bacterium]|nr:TAXI family TRAP transporter solute-binding subunit [Alphaproteobacteria bacterium]
MTTGAALRWATGPEGGSWHRINVGIARLLAAAVPGLEIEIVAAGGRENPELVDRGDCGFGTTIDFVAADALGGRAPYDRAHPNLRSIGTGWSPLPFHFATARSDRRTLLEALRRPGARFGIPPRSTFDELTFRRVMAFAGTSYDAIAAAGGAVLHADYRRLPQAFVAGDVDYFFGATSAPGDPVRELARRPAGARLAEIDAVVIRHLAEAHGYGTGVIRGTHYPDLTTGDLATAVMDTVFLVHRDMPAELVRAITRALIAHRHELPAIHASLEAFDPRRSAAASPVPLHPGAEAAYREDGR